MNTALLTSCAPFFVASLAICIHSSTISLLSLMMIYSLVACFFLTRKFGFYGSSAAFAVNLMLNIILTKAYGSNWASSVYMVWSILLVCCSFISFTLGSEVANYFRVKGLSKDPSINKYIIDSSCMRLRLILRTIISLKKSIINFHKIQKIERVVSTMVDHYSNSTVSKQKIDYVFSPLFSSSERLCVDMARKIKSKISKSVENE